MSLQMLMTNLGCTNLHYVRCIKPNLSKAYGVSELSGEVVRQLRYSGMMDIIRIHQEGHSNQEDHRSFYQQFHILLSMEDAKNGKGNKHLVQVLSKRLSLSEAE
jgi:myosin-5